MKISRKVFVVSLLTLLLVSSFKISVSAAYNNTGFKGKVGSKYEYVSNDGVTKLNSYKNFTVNWTESSHSNINMWFKMVNSNGVSRGQARLGYLEKKTISASSDTKEGYLYWLMAAREHWIDPSTSVEGIWTP